MSLLLLLALTLQPAPDADAIATLVLASPDCATVDQRLQKLDSRLLSSSWALEPLLQRVAAGGAAAVHIDAIKKLDALCSDGAWHLEIAAASFDAVSAHPEVFIRRYLAGDAYSLTIIEHALSWPTHALDVDLACDSTDAEAIARFASALARVASAVEAGTKTSPDSPSRRALRSLVIDSMRSWQIMSREHPAECRKRNEPGAV